MCMLIVLLKCVIVPPPHAGADAPCCVDAAQSGTTLEVLFVILAMLLNRALVHLCVLALLAAGL